MSSFLRSIRTAYRHHKLAAILVAFVVLIVAAAVLVPWHMAGRAATLSCEGLLMLMGVVAATVIAHEWAHVLMVRRLGMPCRFRIVRAEIGFGVFVPDGMPPRASIKVFATGPTVGAALSVAFGAVVMAAVVPSSPLLSRIALISAATALISHLACLIPVGEFDGAKILRARRELRAINPSASTRLAALTIVEGVIVLGVCGWMALLAPGAGSEPWGRQWLTDPIWPPSWGPVGCLSILLPAIALLVLSPRLSEWASRRLGHPLVALVSVALLAAGLMGNLVGTVLAPILSDAPFGTAVDPWEGIIGNPADLALVMGFVILAALAVLRLVSTRRAVLAPLVAVLALVAVAPGYTALRSAELDAWAPAPASNLAVVTSVPSISAVLCPPGAPTHRATSSCIPAGSGSTTSGGLRTIWGTAQTAQRFVDMPILTSQGGLIQFAVVATAGKPIAWLYVGQGDTTAAGTSVSLSASSQAGQGVQFGITSAQPIGTVHWVLVISGAPDHGRVTLSAAAAEPNKGVSR